MKTSTQSEALKVLSEMCEVAPEVRLGQLMAFVGFMGEDHTGHTLWDIEDGQLLEILRKHLHDLKQRQEQDVLAPGR